jgi:hypothetical protein
MHYLTHTFRGQEVDIHYRDHGYEPDTNAHEIDWWFGPGFECDDVTEEEEQAIYDALYERANSYDDYFGD